MLELFPMEIIKILSTAVVIGFINGCLPGPISTAMFTHVVQRDFRTSLKIALWAGCLVAIVATILFATFNFFRPSELLLNSISIVGGVFLIYLAWKIWNIKAIKTDQEKVFSFGNICVIVFLNSSLWLSWLTIFLPEAFKLKEHIFAGEFIFLFVYLLCWLSGLCLVTFMFSRFRPLLTKPNVLPYVFKVFSLILAFFALRMIYTGIKFLLLIL